MIFSTEPVPEINAVKGSASGESKAASSQEPSGDDAEANGRTTLPVGVASDENLKDKKVNPGVYLNMDRDQYDLLPHHNQSRLKKWMALGDLPSEFKYWQEHRHEQKQSESCLLGSALDCAIIEGAYHEKFSVGPECDRRTTVGKKLWSEFLEKSKGKQELTLNQAATVIGMWAALRRCKSTEDVFKNCKKAVLIADLFDFPCKGEIDLWEEKSEHIWDLKALKDVSPTAFSKAFFDYGYDIQATFYLALSDSLGFKKQVFNFICVKNVEPFTVKVHSFAPYDNVDHEAIFAQAHNKIRSAIEELDRSLKANDFEDDDEWTPINVPSWRLWKAV